MSAELWKKVKHFIGMPMDDAEYEEPVPSLQLPQLDSQAPSPSRGVRRVRQERTSGSGFNQIIGFHSALTQSEMLIVEPKGFEEALEIVCSLRERKAVIVNLSALEPEPAQRLIDFVAGATHALDGHQERIGDGIFLFSPSNVVINSLNSDQPWLNRDARDLFWRVS